MNGENNGLLTVGFVQVRLEIVSTISPAYMGFNLGLINITKHWFLIFNFIKRRATVTGGRNSNATLHTKPYPWL